jgi:NADH-quinone oxidoreductase subunit J
MIETAVNNSGSINAVFFYLVALGVLATAIYAVASPKLLNAALSLALSFFAVGGLFFMLGNPFLGILQVLINAGAIPIVTVFIIFMTQSRRARLRSPLNALVALGAIVVLGGALWSFWNTTYQTNSQSQAPQVNVIGVSSRDIGQRLLSAPEVNGENGSLLAFEIASVLLLVAMVGAIILTQREGETIKGEVGVLSEVDKPVAAGALERPAATIERASENQQLERGVA